MTNDINIFAIVPIEVLQDSRLTLRHIKVLMALLSFRNKNTNLTFPTRERLSERCGIHISHISTTTSELVELGWLKKSGKGGFAKATQYVITVPTFETTYAESATVANSDKVETTYAKSATPTYAKSATPTYAKSATRIITDQLTDQLTDHLMVDDGFEEFWNRYPKKVGKTLAHQAWKKNKVKVDEVLKTLQWQIQSEQWQKQNGQFIPNPATYINQGRWQDEPVAESIGEPF